MKHFWEVIVGNVGAVHKGGDEQDARKAYEHYVDLSKSARSGRCAGEPVSLWRDNEPVEEHEGSFASQDN